MNRSVRFAVVCVALSVVLSPVTLLLVLPHFPGTVLGWLALIVLPVPLAAAGEWLFQYREIKWFRPVDQWAAGNAASPYRLAVVIGIVALAGSLGLGAMWLVA